MKQEHGRAEKERERTEPYPLSRSRSRSSSTRRFMGRRRRPRPELVRGQIGGEATRADAARASGGGSCGEGGASVYCFGLRE
ncbi:hypothetical protein EUGRSUZ_A00984 [Eucalyptus grandis]|uniref:Uncharacterized protein n=2 Tax=Eucalyptus grandis TaxID=71139 RepID=A0ACC3M4A0_EUCGR|nr:hypothetical protein EUGRSUZ_A00984 [Eucalyptus grandis]